MNRTLSRLSLLVLFVVLAMICPCQGWAKSSWLFTTDSELPSSLINDIVEDSDGNIWIATEVGLCRYDGARFVSYLNDRNDPHSLCNNFVRCLSLDAKGNLFVGTNDGIQVFRPLTQDFSLRASNAAGEELRGNVAGLSLRHNGELWVCGNKTCCVSVTPEGEALIYDNPLTGVIDLTQSILDDPQGIGWVNQQYKEIYRLMPDGQILRLTEPGANGEEQGLQFSVLKVGLDGQVYAAGERPGLYRYDAQLGKFVQLSSPDASFIVRDIEPIYDGRMLLGTDGDGLMSYDYSTGEIAPYDYDNSRLNSRRQKVHSIYVDHHGNMWLGLFQCGVATLSNRRLPFYYYGSRTRMHDCIGDKCVTHIMRDAEGLMWVTTDGGGIFCIDDDGQQLRAFPSTGNPGEVPSSVITIYEDSHHRFWIGSFHQGVHLLDTRTGRCTPVPVQDHAESSNIYDFVEDDQGNIWCASMGLGLLRYDVARKMFVPSPGYLHSQWVTCLYYDPLTRLLFVGSYNGFHIVDTRQPEADAEQFQSELVVNAITSLDAQTLLISTDVGVCLFDKSTRTPRLLPTPEAAQTIMCYAALPDDKGNIWVTGNKGLGCQDLQSGMVMHYTVHDGLQGNEFYKNASWRDPDGTLWFGGATGITYFQPNEMKEEEIPFTVRVVSLQANATHLAMQERYELDYQDNSFTLDMALQPLLFTYRGRYSYRLDNDRWVTLPEGLNRVSLNHLSPGQHTFYFRAFVDGHESSVASVVISVGYPWYVSWWSILVLMGLLGVFGWLLTSLLMHRRAERQRLVRQKQEEAVKEAKIEFFMNISHELRTPMTLIVSPLQKLIHSDSDPGRQHSYNLMQRNANRILMLINQLMDIRKMDKQQMKLLCQDTEVVPFVMGIFQTFDDIVNLKHLRASLVNQLPEGQRVWLDHDAVEKILVNLLSNAIKYTPDGGSVELLLRVDPSRPSQMLQFVVSDTGVGIGPEDKLHIFDRFYQVRTGAGNTQMGTGIGLNLTYGLVHLHHGEISVDDNPTARGTRFIVSLPLGNSHLQPQELRGFLQNEVPAPAVSEAYPSITTASIATAALSEEVPVGEVRPNSNRHILVVDDDDEIGRYVMKELSPYYRVQQCHNGREALDVILRQTPDLVISDVMMPEMDGVTLLNKIRQNVRISHLPVILLTAKDREEDRLDALEIGADAYLTKPFSVDLLIKTVQNLQRSHDRLRNTFSGQQLPVDQIETPQGKSPDERLLERVNRVIASHIADTGLSAESVAQEVGLSRVHLYRKLKELTNQSARDYIRNIRLAKAAEILAHKKVAVAEVAQMVGFGNPSNFATAFKEVYGMTPTQYMESHIKEVGDLS